MEDAHLVKKNHFKARPRLLYADFALELSRVEWPSRQMLISLSKSVFWVMVFFLIVVSLMDFALTSFLSLFNR